MVSGICLAAPAAANRYVLGLAAAVMLHWGDIHRVLCALLWLGVAPGAPATVLLYGCRMVWVRMGSIPAWLAV